MHITGDLNDEYVIMSMISRHDNGDSKSPADRDKETVANHVLTEAKTSVLLQTDIATVVNNENPEKYIQARIIFDSGMFDKLAFTLPVM